MVKVIASQNVVAKSPDLNVVN